MDFDKWKELIGLIFKYVMILVITTVMAVTISQLILDAVYFDSIISTYKKIGQILPFS